MNLHITPSFNIDRLCKTASVLLFLVTYTSSPLIPNIGFLLNFKERIPGWFPTKVVQIVSVGCISRSQGQKIGFQNAIFKYILVWNYKAQSFHIGIHHHLEVFYHSCYNYAPGVKIDPPRKSQFYIELYKENFKRLLHLTANGNLTSDFFLRLATRALWASVVWHHSLPLMNSFNKTEAAVFSCRLCFLRAFPFISLIFIVYSCSTACFDHNVICW